MPILDIKAPNRELEEQGDLFDVDSLFADAVEGHLADLLRKPGWMWHGRGPWGPFGEEHGFRKGLLPLRAVVEAEYDLVQPTWAATDTSDLAYAAIWGLPDRTGLDWSSGEKNPGPRQAAIPQALAHSGTRATTGSISATTRYIRARARGHIDHQGGVYIIRPEDPKDVVTFWNMRALGSQLLGIPGDSDADVVSGLLRDPLPCVELRHGGSEPKAEQTVQVWGIDHATPVVKRTLLAAAERDGLRVCPRTDRGLSSSVFQGLETRFSRTFRADFRPGDRWIDVALPEMPITTDSRRGIWLGVVAAEVRVYRVTGQDPRLTASIPPFRRHSELLQHATQSGDVDNARVTSEGQVVALDVTRDLAGISFASNLDVFRLLLDDRKATVKQSDVGKFQARAAENFAGPFSGVFNEPGIRSAVLLAARDREGIPLQQLRQTVERHRGDWPGLLSQMTPSEYARRSLDYLLHTGLFVPTLRVHCSYCRVERWASADELAARMPCEFCGQEFNLALSHSLAPPKWRYRLAGHLRSGQVQALLPALAVSSLLGQFRLVEEAPLSHVFGLEVVLEGKKVEADIAAYLPDHDWTAVIGEVKNANRIDANDVSNIESVEHHLRSRGVRCLSLFATLKNDLTPEEVQVLRQRVERSRLVRTSRGDLLPSMPLVLTGVDLSHPPLSEDHPWRWDNKGFAGILGTAITSCERNLGLTHYSYDNRDTLTCHWRPDNSQTTPGSDAQPAGEGAGKDHQA